MFLFKSGSTVYKISLFTIDVLKTCFINESLFVGTFLALHGFFKQVNRVLNQLKI